MFFAEAIERFLQSLQERGYSQRTVQGYRADLTACLKFVVTQTNEGAPTIAHLDTDLIRAFVAAPGSSGRPPSAPFRNRRLSALRAFFSYLRETGRWDGEATPDRHVRFSRLPRTEPSFLHYDEYLAILDAIRKTRSLLRRTRDFAMVVAFFNTGLRLSELTSLDLWQFNPAARVFSAVRRKGNVVQDVLFNRNVTNAIGTWLQLRPAGDGPLFLGRGRQWA